MTLIRSLSSICFEGPIPNNPGEGQIRNFSYVTKNVKEEEEEEAEKC
jgi:hypothetical protein